MNKPSNKDSLFDEVKQAQQSRRNFLRYAGTAGLIAVGAASCNKFGDYFPHHGGENAKTIDLGKGDYGILNYAYALEQLEAAFYTKVIDDSMVH